MSVIGSRRIAVLGYGNLGRPVALNLRDSGLRMLIGNRADDYAGQASADGFEVVPIAEASRRAEIILLLLPDEVMGEVYAQAISPTLKPSDTLIFTSGYTIAFGFIEPPPFVDALLIAPRTIGSPCAKII